MTVRVFLSAAKSVAPQCNDVADNHLSGFDITSQWHRALPKRDPNDTCKRRDALEDNLERIRRSDIIVALLHDGKPQAAIAEVGYALALSKPVIWVYNRGHGGNIFDSHPLVTMLETGDGGPEQLKGLIRTVLKVEEE